MSNNKDKPVSYATVMESLPNALFRVKLDGDESGNLILSFMSGKMSHNRIRVVIGDRVMLDNVDLKEMKARITRRM